MRTIQRLSMVFLLALAAVDARAALLVEQDVDQDGEKEIILENRWERLVLKPSIGAATSLIVKPSGTEMVSSGGKGTPTLLGDAVTQQGAGDFSRRPYSFQVLLNADDTASVKLWRRGQTDLLQWITMAKTVTLRADRPEIEVVYEIANDEASKQSFRLGLWVHSQVSAQDQEMTYYIPLPSGLSQRRTATGPAGGTDLWYYDVVRGWVAARAENGAGVCFRFDYTRLMAIYQFMKGGQRTLEVLYRSQDIPNDGAFRTTFHVLPFSGLPYVDGVVEGHAGCIYLPRAAAPGKEGPVRVLLTPGQAGVRAALTARRLPDKTEVRLGEVALTTDPEGRLAGETAFSPPTDGTYVLRAVVTRAGQTLGEFERPLTVVKDSGQYVLRAIEERVGDSREAFQKTIAAPTPAGKTGTKDIPVQKAPPDIELAEGVDTPHIPWAKPYYLGRTRVLIMVNTESEREVIELAERFSMDFKRVTHGASGWKVPSDLVKTWNAAAAAARQKEILEKDPLDVIIMTAEWSAFDPEVQLLIAKRVQGGTGLVVVSPRVRKPDEVKDLPAELGRDFIETPSPGMGDATDFCPWVRTQPHPVTSGIPFEAMKTRMTRHTVTKGETLAEGADGDKRQPLVVVGEIGKGRVVCLNYNGMQYTERVNKLVPNVQSCLTVGYPDANPACPTFDWYEYAWSLLIKSALWASGREPELRLEEIAADAGGDGVTLSLDNTTKAADCDIELTVRDAWSDVEARQMTRRSVAAGKVRVTLPLPLDKLSGGLHFADVIIRSGGLVMNWGTATFHTKQPVAISVLKLEKPRLQANDTLRATATFSTPLPKDTPLRVIATLRDARGRDVRQAAMPANGTHATSVEFPAADLETAVFHLRVEVFEGTRRAAKAQVRGTVARYQAWDDFAWGVEFYGGSYYYTSPAYYERLRELGVSIVQASVYRSHDVGQMADAGMHIADVSNLMPEWSLRHNKKLPISFPEMKALYYKTRDLKYLERTPCFNDPDFRQESLKIVRRVVPVMSGVGAWDFCIADELSLTVFGDAYDFCFCEHCLEKFRQWIKPQYKDLAELNGAYGMQFKDWADARPVTYMEAKSSGKWSGWADHRKFMEAGLAEYFLWLRAEAQKIDPNARISLSGTQAPGAYNGSDVWLRCKSFDALWDYHAAGQYAMHRSFKPGLKLMPWLGYAASGPSQYAAIWQKAFNQSHGAAFWWFYQILNPDWRLSPSGQTWAEAMPDLIGGIGKTILTSDFEDYGIAIHYSQDSIHAACALDAGDSHAASRVAWLRAIEGYQLQARFLSYEQLERGDLAWPRTRVFILPYSVSLSDKEAEAIRAYVRSGGTLIADAQTGVMDPHCRFRDNGAIDDVLGIRRLSMAVGYTEGNAVCAAPAGWKDAGGDLGLKPLEPGIQTTTGKALAPGASAPAVIVNSFGKGKTWYLNLDLGKMELLQRKGADRPLLSVVRLMLEDAGAKPFAALLRPDGARLENCLVFAYHRGPLHYVGLLPAVNKDLPPTVEARLVVPEGLRLFDVRARKPLPGGALTLEQGMPRFLALLPYTVKGITLEAPRTARQGDPLAVAFAVRTDGPAAGDHVVRVTTQGPDGREVYYLCKNVATTQGKGEFRTTLALNAPVGDWKITARDIATGVAQTAVIRVEAGPGLAPAATPVAYPQAPLPPTTPAAGGPHVTRDAYVPSAALDAPFDPSKGLLKNPTFVEDAEKDGAPRDWSASVGRQKNDLSKLKIEKDETVLFQGRPSTRFTFGPFPERTSWQLAQSISWKQADLRGKKIKLTFYIYRDAPNKDKGQDFSFRCRLPSVKGGYTKDWGLQLNQTTVPGTWTRVVITGKVDEEAAGLQAIIQNDTREDRFWISGFLLEEMK